MNFKYRDKVVIPDKYNTGCDESKLTPIEDLIPSWSRYMLPATIKANGNSYVFENVLFTGQINYKPTINHEIIFRNCKFVGDGNGYYAIIQAGGEWGDVNAWTFDHCTFYNFKSASVQMHPRCHFSYCQFHHNGGDGGKASSYSGYENCYFYDFGLAPGAHADGIQTTAKINQFYVRNCRFDMPATATSVSNAGIFFVQEYDAIDCELKDILIEGGGYSIYLGLKNKESGYQITNLVGDNIKVGKNRHFGIFCCSYPEYSDWVKRGVISEQDKIFVSSVYKKEDGKIVLHATNYTLEDRPLVLVTDKETKTVTVPHCFDYATGKTLSFSDFPFDVEFEIEGNEVIAYDTSISEENQIRAVEFEKTDDSVDSCIITAMQEVLESDTSISFNFDKSKTLLMASVVDVDPETSIGKYNTIGQYGVKTPDGTFSTCTVFNSYVGKRTTGVYGSIIVDQDAGTVTFVTRTGKYRYRAGRTYRMVCMYATQP